MRERGTWEAIKGAVIVVKSNAELSQVIRQKARRLASRTRKMNGAINPAMRESTSGSAQALTSLRMTIADT